MAVSRCVILKRPTAAILFLEVKQMNNFAKLAFEEYSSPDTPVRHGGVDGKPFWNIHSTQFMFAPALFFPCIPWATNYTYTATDSQGKSYSFNSPDSCAPLYPIWSQLSTGFVELRVEAEHKNGEKYLAGARTFYKMEPFPGRDALPPRARSYKDAMLLGFKYLIEDPTTRSWLERGLPDAKYFHNAYPSKMISSIINAMIEYVRISPEVRDEAIGLARGAADYLLSITYGDDYALCGLPPTYSCDNLDIESVREHATAGIDRAGQVMMIYPADVGRAYFKLYEETGDKKYFDAAVKIADYYKKNVLENGSFSLMVSAKSGEPLSKNCCVSFRIAKFLKDAYNATGDKAYCAMEEKYFRYLLKTRLTEYSWEGQFEDSPITTQYENLTHFDANAMIEYITENLSDNAELMEEAVKLMRYVEDQFVTWGKFAPWSKYYREGHWSSPAAMEQYNWHVPIDGSAAAVINAFLSLYDKTKNELYLEKAKAFGDSITRMQHPTVGVIPTHWMDKNCTELVAESPCNDNFWINCHIGTTLALLRLAKVCGEI